MSLRASARRGRLAHRAGSLKRVSAGAAAVLVTGHAAILFAYSRSSGTQRRLDGCHGRAVVSERDLGDHPVSRQHDGQPVPGVVPHAVERQCVDREPARHQFVGLSRLAIEVGGDIDIGGLVPGRAGREDKGQVRQMAKCAGRDDQARLLLYLASGRLGRLLAVLDVTAEPDPPAGSETSLLETEQYLPVSARLVAIRPGTPAAAGSGARTGQPGAGLAGTGDQG